LVAHSLAKGWDNAVGGFYDEGYYFKDSYQILQLPGILELVGTGRRLNTLLLMADLYPQDTDYNKFKLNGNTSIHT
jgi:mannobiose 2-epimerase